MRHAVSSGLIINNIKKNNRIMKNIQLLLLAIVNGFNGFCCIDANYIVVAVICFAAMLFCIGAFFKLYYDNK